MVDSRDEAVWAKEIWSYEGRGGESVSVVKWTPREGYGRGKPEYVIEGSSEVLVDVRGDGLELTGLGGEVYKRRE